MNPNEQTDQTTVIKQKLCTVTPFSKFLATIVFITLPFIGFWVGRQYPNSPTEVPVSELDSNEDSETVEGVSETEETTNPPSSVNNAPTSAPSPSPSPAPVGPSEITVYITDMTPDNLSVDNIAIYEGDAAIQRMIADELCTAAEPEKCRLIGGVYYRNTDPSIRTYPLSENVDVRTWTGSEYSIGKLINSARNQKPYSITINSSGKVTQIKEVFRP